MKWNLGNRIKVTLTYYSTLYRWQKRK